MRIVVTGASRGIGAAICDELEAFGFEVVRFSRTHNRDVTSDQLETWLDEIGHVDGVITCAGVAAMPGPLVAMSDDDWAESLDVNLTHHMRVARWFVKRGRPGPIVFISSTAGTRPSPEWTPYAAAKAALINVGLSLAAELRRLGYRVYTVAPGRCATNLRAVLAPDEDPETIMQPHEVAKVVRQLVGDQDGLLAGQVIQVSRT